MSIKEILKRPNPFKIISLDELMELISKPSFQKTAATLKRTINPKFYKGYTVSSVAFYLGLKPSWPVTMDVPKGTILLHVAVSFKSPTSGNPEALIVTGHSPDGKLWIRDVISETNGYHTVNPLANNNEVMFLKKFDI